MTHTAWRLHENQSQPAAMLASPKRGRSGPRIKKRSVDGGSRAETGAAEGTIASAASQALTRKALWDFAPPALPCCCHGPRYRDPKPQRNAPLRALCEADGGTRTHDLLHGKR